MSTNGDRHQFREVDRERWLRLLRWNWLDMFCVVLERSLRREEITDASEDGDNDFVVGCDFSHGFGDLIILIQIQGIGLFGVVDEDSRDTTIILD